MSAQSDEKVTVRVSIADLKFIESVRDRLGKEFEVLKRVQLESSDEISNGGCVVETNYGDVNATLEQRFQSMWNSISEKLPKINDVIASEASGNEPSGQSQEE